MFCPACGTRATEGDRFCQQCGRALPRALPEAVEPEALELAPGDEHRGAPSASSAAPTSSAPAPLAVGAPAPPRLPPYWSPPPYGAAPWPGQPPAEPGRLSAFGAPLASWWQRVGAMLLDSVVVGIPLAILDAIALALFGTKKTSETLGVMTTTHSLTGGGELLVLAALSLLVGGYFAIGNGLGKGQTPGDTAPGIAVRDASSGEAIGLRRGVLRWLVRFLLYLALILPGLVNDLFPLFDRRSQSLADKLVRSVVVRLR